MRTRNFFLLAQTYTGDGGSESFGVTGSNSEIGSTNLTFQSALAKHDTNDNDPSGNYNLFVSDRTISAGSAAIQFSKSAVSGSTTDSIDVVILAARG